MSQTQQGAALSDADIAELSYASADPRGPRLDQFKFARAILAAADRRLTAERGGADEKAQFEAWQAASPDKLWNSGGAGLGGTAWAAWQARAALTTQPQVEPARCPLCRYQHGHMIGCKNNPVDMALREKNKSEPIRMILCPKCGNKRCPHANDHNNACTNSNDAGQPGSAYP